VITAAQAARARLGRPSDSQQICHSISDEKACDGQKTARISGQSWIMDPIDPLLFLHKAVGHMCEIAANQNLPPGPRAVILRIATEIMDEARGLQAQVGSLAVLRRVASDVYQVWTLFP
jgi:hypothetical protein